MALDSAPSLKIVGFIDESNVCSHLLQMHSNCLLAASGFDHSHLLAVVTEIVCLYFFVAEVWHRQLRHLYAVAHDSFFFFAYETWGKCFPV
jgi:hypothetical protein